MAANALPTTQGRDRASLLPGWLLTAMKNAITTR
jgi:hypothetical protein